MRKVLRSIIRALGLYSFSIKLENKIVTALQKPKQKKLYSQFVKPGSLCFDVGANVGNRTALFLELGANVVMVEPQKECYQALEKRFPNLPLVKKGLGEKESTEKLYVSDVSLISSFSKSHVDMMQEDRFKGANWDKTIDIEMTTLDNLIKQYGVPDFCKIDVEGYEYDVLKGLSQPVKAMSLEYIVPENKEVVLNCIKHLNKLGKIECNLSHGETMEFHLPTWKNGNEMEQYVQTQDFINTSYGDIYVRFV
ncbi:MAG: FkbM family methyltransferase [Flavobacteriales bacterium]|nr:MAG: FkbM family methyltransferase [Flavobacteriales bacterium]MBE7441444.1 FkbM family methyltransferase [Flavobacteriales bacterium]MBX2960309.1 FkbM family methyltransferase [Flavobacteriales bacterium]HRN41362.1 FkbM family methyltransferase [Vicingus sp.]HRP59349.1 FkbM family methyltransferase [Vicingus sp.]